MAVGTKITLVDNGMHLREDKRMAISNLEEFCSSFTNLLAENKEWPEFLEKGRAMLSELVLQQDWSKPILSKLILDEAFLQSQWQSIDNNDIQIYRDPNKQFSVRAFIWEADLLYPIHDHGSWGIVGGHINQIREKKYVRVDDGQVANYAEVKVSSEMVLDPGGITVVLPLNDGIHQMQAVDHKTAVTIHVYGSPVRKGYIHYFDPHFRTLHRVYPPAITKKILAIRTLGSMPQGWAEEVLNQAASQDVPDFIRNECKLALDKINRT
jgi:predicted metal-dependent enzyme (double-stranded beta helix superfamily)